MKGKKLIAIEAMTLGIKAMAEHAASLGYEFELLTEDTSIYIDLGDTAVTQLSTRNSAALTAYVSAQHDEIASIFSCTDTWGVVAAELRETFGFASRITSSKLLRMRDKAWVQARLQEDNQADSSRVAHHFPMIAKPRGGTGSTDIHLLETVAQRQQFLNRVDNPNAYVLQPFFRGPLYSAEVWSNGQTMAFFGVTNRIMTVPPRFLEQAKSFPHAANTLWEASVKVWAEDLIDKLNYDLGLAHIEFIETQDGFKLVDFNARMAGSLITPAIDKCTNYDPYAIAITDALDILPNALDALPKARIIHGGYSHISIYAEHLGTLEAIDGIQALRDFPGDATWLPSKSIGSKITDTCTYRSRIGNIFAIGPSAAIAQDRALAAAAAIKVRIA